MSATAAIADAATAGWRVAGLLAEIDNRSRSVDIAAAVIITKTSPNKHCVSNTFIPVHPSPSAWRARAPIWSGRT